MGCAVRVCLIGNSHVAAVQSALEAERQLNRHTVDVYAIPGGRQPIVRFADGYLHPAEPQRPVITTIDGAEEKGLCLADYDALIVSACGRLAIQNTHVQADPGNHPLGCVSRGEWGTAKTGALVIEPRIVSLAVFHAVVDGFVQSHGSVELLRLLEANFAGRVIVQPCPAPNRSLLSDDSWFLNAWYGSGAGMAWRDFFLSQRATLGRVLLALGPRFGCLGHPYPAASDDGFMDGSWCMPDPWHANPHYGALVVDQIARTLNES